MKTMYKVGKYFCLLLLITFIPLFYEGLSTEAAAAGNDITSKFTDMEFQAVVYSAIGKSAPEPILDTDVAKVKELYIYYDAKNLDGLEYFASLLKLECRYNDLESLPTLPQSLVVLKCNNNHLTALPDLPPNLEILMCGDNQLTTLPELPPGLRRLDFYGNEVYELPDALPSKLTYMHCGNNNLSVLPELPPSLISLYCQWNKLTIMPMLPSGLKFLYCYSNQLTALPTLPKSLEELDCTFNELTLLPELPQSLKRLDCYSNELTLLPELPHNLKMLYCSMNSLTMLPTLPQNLKELDCSMNSLTMLPTLPQSLEEFDCSYNQLMVLPAIPASLVWINYDANPIVSPPILPSRLKNYANAEDVPGVEAYDINFSLGFDNTSDVEVSIFIDGEQIRFDESSGMPFLDINDRVQVPFREAMEAYGATVEWDTGNNAVYVEKDGITIEVPIGSEYIAVKSYNDVIIDNDTSALVCDGNVYLPIRIVMEALGASVGWDSDTNTVSIEDLATVKPIISHYNYDPSLSDITLMPFLWIQW